jgi:hypothetical protein
MRLIVAAVACLGVCCLLTPARAEEAGGDTLTIASHGELPKLVGFAIPALPAVQVLGIPTNKVQRPNTLRDVVSTVASGVDGTGNLKTGFAAGGRLWDFTKIAINSDQYAASPWLLNTQWSIGAVKASTDQNRSAQVALGLQIPIIEETYSADLDKAIAAAQTEGTVKALAEGVKLMVGAYPPGTIPDRITSDLQAYCAQPSALTQLRLEADLAEANGKMAEADKCLDAEVGALREKLRCAPEAERPVAATNLLEATDQRTRRQEAKAKYASVIAGIDKGIMDRVKTAVDARWNAGGLSLAFAPGWLSKSGDSGDFAYNGTQIWISGAVAGGTRWQYLFLLAYRDKNVSADPKVSGAFVREDTAATVGARSVYGGASQGVALELAYRTAGVAGGGQNQTFSTVLSYEHQMSDDQWLQLAAGAQTGDDKQTRLSFSYNLAFGKTPVIARPPKKE